MADFALFNRLGMSVKRIDFVGGVHTVEPPEEIQPNTTLTWQSEDTGSVTYQVASEGSERGAPRRFTLEWAFTASGTPTGRVRNVDRGLKITIEQRSDGARFTVARKRARRVPPPAPRLGGALSRLAPLPVVVSGLIILALLAGSVTVLANPLHWPLRLPTFSPQAQATPAQLAVSPSQATSVDCATSSLSYPAITVRNTGGQTLNWQASATVGTALVSPRSGSLAPGKAQTISVSQPGPTATPTDVNISSNGGAATVVVYCQGATPPPRLAVSPTEATTVTCSGSSVPYPAITVRNIGGQTLQWRASVTVAGAKVSPASGSLSAGQSQTLAVTQPGPAQSATNVAIISNGGSATVVFSCKVSPPPPTRHGNLTVNPTSLVLGNYCGQSFSGVSITLSNTGNGSLTWSQSGGSGLSLAPSSGQLNAGQSASVSVSGTRSNTTLNIGWQDGGQGNTNTVTVSLSCIAPPPPHANLRVTQNQNYQSSCSTYTNTPPPTYAVTLDNTGSNVSVAWQIAWPIVNGSPFQWANASPSGGTLAVGQTTSFQFTPVMGSSCPPPGNTWLMHYGLHLSFPQGGSQPDIGLTDNITDPPLTPPNLTVNPTRVSIGGACGTSATVTLGNTGQQTLSWWVSSTANGASVSSTSGSIAGGQTIQVTVYWTPIDPSSDGYVYIASNAANNGGNATIDINGPCPYIGTAIPSGHYNSGAMDAAKGEGDVRSARVA